MQHSMTQLMRDGKHYMDTWPVEKQLYQFFVDLKVISATRLAISVMPVFAVLSCSMLVKTNGTDYLPQGLAVGCFFMSLPIQGMIWLGFRSNQPLPPSLRAWYRKTHEKLIEHGCSVDALRTHPRYIELADLLKAAFAQTNRAFRQNLF